MAQDKLKARGTEENNAYLVSFSKWMVEYGLGEITKRQFIKSYEGEEIVESHNHLCPHGKRYIKKTSIGN